MSGEQSDQKGAPVHGTAERGGSGGDGNDPRRHHVHYIPQMLYSSTQQPIGVFPIPISVPILEAAAAMQASRQQQEQARVKIAADKRRERERVEMEKKVRENLRRESLKTRLTLLSAPDVCYNASSYSADIYWMGVSEDEQETTLEENGGDTEKDSEAVVYHLTMQEGEVRKEVYRGPDCEHTVSSLLPGHTYTFSLIACLNDVYGSSSPPYNLAVPPEPPNRPAPPRMATKSKTAITLRWTASADNGSPLDQYKLEWDQCGGEIVEVYCGKDKQYKMQHKFPPGAVAKFRVSAHNQAGWSECSDWLVYEVHITASVPAAPSPPSLIAATVNSLSLSWDQPESKGAPITSYTLQMDDQDSGYGFQPVYQDEEREYTCRDLKRVTEYSFRVAASNSKGTGPFSSPSVYSTLPDRPGPPADLGLSGKVHPSSFTIAWSPPHDIGGSDIDSYCLLLDDGAGGEMVEVYRGSELSYQAQGLTPGQTYCCKVSSTSVGGEGSWSSIVQLTTPPIAPSCPLRLRLSGKVTATHVTLQWDKSEFDGGAPVISYAVQGKVIGEEEQWTVFGTVANPEAFSTIHTQEQSPDMLSITLSSLAPGTHYEFRVCCTNKVGSSPPSTMCQYLSAPGAPDPPTDPRVVSVSALTAVLAWQPSLDHGTSVTGYQLEHWLDTTDTQTSRKQLSVTALQATVRGLSPASTYWYRLRAGSAAGHSVWTNPLSFSTTHSTPGPPRHLSVLTRAADSLLLVWASPLTHGSPVTSYTLEVAGRQEIVIASSTETQFTITDLQPCTTYKFRLQAENIVGKGPFTPYMTSSTLPLPPPPPSLTLLSCSSTSFKLSWSEKTKGKSSSATASLSYTLQMAAREGSSHYSTLYRGTSLGYKVQKLRPNTSHSFRIAASSESGQGAWSTAVVFMTTPTAPSPPTGLLLRLMSASECLLSWEGVEGENMTYEAQYRKTGTQDYRQVYSDVKASCVVPAASPGASCEARVRAMEKVTVNGREEQLFSSFSTAVVCETPLPAEKEPIQEASLDQAVEASLNKQQQNAPREKLLQNPKCVSALLMIVMISVGVLMALLMAQFIN